MKTKIKTKELLKILDVNSCIFYNGINIDLDLTKINEYIQHPKNNNVFEHSDDIEESFYRNLVLYIINSNDEPKLIKIDLDNDNPIQKGVFELVKNIFNNVEITYLDISENGNNSFFIKNKNLVNLIDDIDFASDIELGDRTAVFINSEKVVEKNKFFWTSQQSDNYSDIDFIINKLVEKVKPIDTSDKNNDYNEFYNILKLSDQSLINSEEFNLALLKANNSVIENILIQNKHPDIFSINFSKDYIYDFFLEKIENRDFNLISKIFKYNIASKLTNSYSWVKDRVKNKSMTFETVHDINFTPTNRKASSFRASI